MRILFFDTICYKPYDGDTLRNEPLGGAEGAVIRVAEGLAARPEVAQVRVMQHNRTVAGGDDRLRYIGPNDDPGEAPTHIIVIRTPLYVQNLRAGFPEAKIYLWSHDMFIGPEWLEPFRHIQASSVTPVCVSAWHRQQLLDLAASLGIDAMTARFIYNPIDDDLAPDDTPCENDKLVFFSSPHKGLKNTLRVFRQFQDIPRLREMKLYLANPGYVDGEDVSSMRNVVDLGKLSHRQAISHVRSSFAVLHLNNERAETFGLVHAEANAVGVPFLNGRMGATPEICPDPTQFVDVEDVQQVAARLLEWQRAGRPRVQVNPAFRRHSVVDAWIDMLGA